MKVKVGDLVKIIAGQDKGKEGKVIATLKNKDKVVVEGIHIVKKHQKPNNMNQTGGIFETEAPIHVSNVKVIKENKKDKKEAKEAKVEKAPKKAAAKKTTTKKAK